MNTLSPSFFTEVDTVRLVELGSKQVQDSTQRVWHFGKAAAAAELTIGQYQVAATQDAQRIDLSFAVAPAIGDKKASVTIGTGDASENDYQDGWLVVQDGTGEGQTLPIEGHADITASTAGIFHLKEKFRIAGAVSETNVDLVKNRYDDIVESVADHADPSVGVPNVTIALSNFGWLQTWGPCAVRHDEAVTAGAAITGGDTTVGEIEVQTAGDPFLGHQGPVAGVADEYQLVYLAIDR